MRDIIMLGIEISANLFSRMMYGLIDRGDLVCRLFAGIGHSIAFDIVLNEPSWNTIAVTREIVFPEEHHHDVQVLTVGHREGLVFYRRFFFFNLLVFRHL